MSFFDIQEWANEVCLTALIIFSELFKKKMKGYCDKTPCGISLPINVSRVTGEF